MSKLENAIVDLVKNEIGDVEDLESELEDLKSTVSDLDSRVDDIDGSIDTINDEIRCANKRMDDYEADLSILEKEIRERVVKTVLESFVGMSFITTVTLKKLIEEQNAKQNSGENKEAPVAG